MGIVNSCRKMRTWITGRRWVWRTAIGALGIVVAASICNWFIFPLPIEKLQRPSSTFVYSRDGHLLNCFTSSDRYWRKPVKLEQISPLLIKSVLATEDRWFYWHPGFNPIALTEAAISNARAGKFVRGGSTITMQIARMMEPKERTIGGKLVEILRSMQLELRFSKRQLLEIYFNLAPYGGNIEGVGAAAYLYFDKGAEKLSLSEAAVLTALPASPTQFRPDKDLAKCTVRRNKVLKHLREVEAIEEEEYQQALREEIPTNRVSPAVAAPHFCQMAIAAYPGKAEIKSTLSYRLQTMCENLSKNYQSELAAKGIQNLSMVVLDNKTGDLLAMIGSADFADINHQGQVNGALAPRSPGSALKPFVYALGFQKGIISPALKVEDLPVNYAGYVPVNYDEQFHGITSVSEALIQSLNVPAVNLTAKVGLKEFYDLLQAGGITTLDRKYNQYGLPIILGSCEVNLLQLSNLYSTLARGGEYLPVRICKSDNPGQPSRILTPEACYLVTEIMADLKRPDLPASWEFTVGMPKVAWKTGTSFGRKDAWAIGFDPDYTVGVWAGNFSAEGSVAIVGAEIAAPLMLEVFGQLYPEGQTKWIQIPPNVGTRTVCASTGKLPGDDCPDLITEPYIIGVSPVDKCSVHKVEMVDAKTGYSVCKFCSAGKTTQQVVAEDWPPRLASWMSQKGMISLLPRHNPDCRGVSGGEGPVITSPEADAVYVLRGSAPTKFQHIMFQASLAADCREAHWFLDGQLYYTVPPDSSVFYAPEAGFHQLMCVDSYGRSSSISFRVQ
jgi:penicillin-binding protein 1C